MYTREIQAPRGSPVENGKPVTGTWNTPFAKVDLLEIHRPYYWPLPRWLRDLRIKEWESFSIQSDRFVLEALLGNFKLYQAALVFVYDKESGENCFYHKLGPGNAWKLPRRLAHGAVECRSSRFFFRIHAWLNADIIRLDIDIAATRKQPAFTAEIAFCMGRQEVTPLAVSLNIAEQRNIYAFKALAPVRGDIEMRGQHASLDPARCTGLFRDYKGFFPYRLRGTFCGSMGFDEEDRRFGFHIVENQARENRKNNENALWAGGSLTPLPPVLITMPRGQDQDWVIQDLDGMVDLVFTPKEVRQFGGNLLFTNSDFFAAIGYYNGILVSAEDEHIQVRNQWGIGEKLFLRM